MPTSFFVAKEVNKTKLFNPKRSREEDIINNLGNKSRKSLNTIASLNYQLNYGHSNIESTSKIDSIGLSNYIKQNTSENNINETGEPLFSKSNVFFKNHTLLAHNTLMNLTSKITDPKSLLIGNKPILNHPFILTHESQLPSTYIFKQKNTFQSNKQNIKPTSIFNNQPTLTHTTISSQNISLPQKDVKYEDQYNNNKQLIKSTLLNKNENKLKSCQSTLFQYNALQKHTNIKDKKKLPSLLLKQDNLQDKLNTQIYKLDEGLKQNIEDTHLSTVSTTTCLSSHYSHSTDISTHGIQRRRTSTLKDIDGEYIDDIPIETMFIQPLFTSECLLYNKKDQLTHIASQHIDFISYGHFWYLYQKKRESIFQPWQFTLTGKMEKLRLNITAMYWESIKLYPISLSTIYIAIYNFNRLLSSWPPNELEHPPPAQWALTAVVAYKLAFKLEERPETLWEVNNFWDIFPMFSDWVIDRSNENMNRVEMGALEILNEIMDLPLAPMFLSLYLTAGGWPDTVSKEYNDLALYILGVVTFTSVKDQLLKNVVPSIMAIAALILAIKIVNGDRTSPSGILPHLKECPYYENIKNQSIYDIYSCICRYEFFPDRLKKYCNIPLSEILPVIRGLSTLLRTKPDETYALKYSFPLWGEHDWR